MRDQNSTNLNYKNNKKLQELLQEYPPSKLRVIRIFLKSREEVYVIPKSEYEAKSEEERLPIIYSNLQGENSEIKKGIENLVSFIREKGTPISIDKDTWKALNFSLPIWLFIRDID